MPFEQGRDYLNVYFMAIDAKGHSTIVRQNDADTVDRIFDAFEDLVFGTVDAVKEEERCQDADFWGWAGDGGLCIVHDTDESRARRTALEAASRILSGLPRVNEHLREIGAHGELAVRIALHKGGLRYKGDDARGSVHSRELNFCAHLEHATPVDCIAISGDIYQLLGDEQGDYLRTGSAFEDTAVFLKTARASGEVRADWHDNVSASEGTALTISTDVPPQEFGVIGLYSQRSVGPTLNRLLDNTDQRLWVMGIGLGGFRADHEERTRSLLETDVDVRLLALDPNTDHAAVRFGEGDVVSLVEWCDREAEVGYNVQTASEVAGWVQRVNDATAEGAAPLQMRHYSAVPSAAVFISDDTVLLSPYMFGPTNVKLPMYELLAGKRYGRPWVERFEKIWNSDLLSRPS